MVQGSHFTPTRTSRITYVSVVILCCNHSYLDACHQKDLGLVYGKLHFHAQPTLLSWFEEITIWVYSNIIHTCISQSARAKLGKHPPEVLSVQTTAISIPKNKSWYSSSMVLRKLYYVIYLFQIYYVNVKTCHIQKHLFFLNSNYVLTMSVALTKG